MIEGTPRTDAEASSSKTGKRMSPNIRADFARMLELELNQRNQACDDYAATVYRQAAEIVRLNPQTREEIDEQVRILVNRKIALDK